MNSLGISVLIVDDAVDVAEALAKAIQMKSQASGLKIRSIVLSHDGMDATIKLKNQAFDVVILDNDMPKKNGLGVLKFINDSKLDYEVNVIFLSGELHKETLQVLKKMHIVDVLAKPFDIERIMKNILKVTQKK
ncbi:MAG: hypothetical protein A2381_01895 [Bdellovibrionales bacterium RIFOXYB1_FULL_37_110]|nr:MAG: hypothetical protein A2417_09845 [Bdellovibrionales bacterium RIFOXYC1_FULL_37_79]OFZ58968.1 MAG: hypothetical protein A2381_01895 [Bdellovibrionales bacterium RIFOXYB1_FULL_37_110]OFZ63787.1 MAG: hypothetical protein A2328_06495 [Bdellovibrionales bacterium RIFOXYB2_FULL_36_6]OFZ64586.1 MAG: hypothetical protein A2577_13040 [Bdellovibrionales bacterium RIFOXYD1_FULL_36_51]